MKPYIKEAYTEFINANKDTYPSEVDFVIENTGTIKELENKLAQLLVKIREEG